MAEEMESPTEQAQEDMHHHAEHSTEKWIGRVALTSALLAALAAVNSLLAGHYVNEAILEQMRETNKWNYYQSKGIKAGELTTKVDLLRALEKPVRAADEEKLIEYRKQQEEISKDAKAEGEMSRRHMEQHHILARGVTMFQVAIAIAAISVLSRRPPFWYVSLGFGAAGLLFLVWGLLPVR